MPKATKPATKPRPAPVLKFTVIDRADIPEKTKLNKYEAEYRAAMAQADLLGPDKAVILFDTMGDAKLATQRRSSLRSWLAKQKLDGLYDVVNRTDKVYLWKNN